MRRGALFFAVIVAALAAGCGRPARRAWRPRSPEPGDDAPAAFVVVRATAPLYVAPDRRASTVALPAAGFLPFRILRERDGWAWLETLGGSDETHCAPSVPTLEPFRLRLYAPAPALVSVTTREVDQAFADETSLHLARGVPLEPVPGDRLFRAHLGVASAVVRVDPTDVGTRYLPSDPIDRGPRGEVLSASALRSGMAILGATGRLTAHSSAGLPIHARHERGAAEQLVEVRPRCARVQVRVPPEAVEPTPDLLSHDDEPVGPPFVAEGSPVFWANGQRAGMVTRQAAVRGEIDPVEGLRCFRHPLGADRGAETSVFLCFRPRDVVDEGAAAARRLDPPG